MQNIANKRLPLGTRIVKTLKRQWPLHLMLLPGVVLLLLFSYYPMTGVVVAFQRFNPRLGLWDSPYVGLRHFEYMFMMPDTRRAIFNTIFIAFMKIVGGLIVPIIFALLLDMVRHSGYKRSIQTIIYFPYFLSWVILGGILIDILSPSTGMVGMAMKALGLEPIYFLGRANLFPYVLVVTDVWKNFGYGTIVYLAAIASIDTEQYEAARIDGANRFQQAIFITLPGMMPIIILMATLALGNVLNAGFDQVLNLYNDIVRETGDIIDTLVYRIGLLSNRYEIATAVGLFKSVVSLIFISIGYWLAKRFAGYTVF